MKHTIKYTLVQIELLSFIVSFILGIGAAEVENWWLAYALMFCPFLFGYIFNLGKQLEFCDAYNRAYRIKHINK